MDGRSDNDCQIGLHAKYGRDEVEGEEAGSYPSEPAEILRVARVDDGCNDGRQRLNVISVFLNGRQGQLEVVAVYIDGAHRRLLRTQAADAVALLRSLGGRSSSPGEEVRAVAGEVEDAIQRLAYLPIRTSQELAQVEPTDSVFTNRILRTDERLQVVISYVTTAFSVVVLTRCYYIFSYDPDLYPFRKEDNFRNERASTSYKPTPSISTSYAGLKCTCHADHRRITRVTHALKKR